MPKRKPRGTAVFCPPIEKKGKNHPGRYGTGVREHRAESLKQKMRGTGHYATFPKSNQALTSSIGWTILQGPEGDQWKAPRRLIERSLTPKATEE